MYDNNGGEYESLNVLVGGGVLYACTIHLAQQNNVVYVHNHAFSADGILAPFGITKCTDIADCFAYGQGNADYHDCYM